MTNWRPRQQTNIIISITVIINIINLPVHMVLLKSIDWVKVFCPARHKTGHFGDILPSQLLGIVPKKLNITQQKQTTQEKTRMWANAQRDGRPAEYRWRPLFNAAKFGWRPILECRAVTLPRRETRWNYLGCPKLAKRFQPLVGRSSPYCGNMWRRYCCLTCFFRLSICALVAKI